MPSDQEEEIVITGSRVSPVVYVQSGPGIGMPDLTAFSVSTNVQIESHPDFIQIEVSNPNEFLASMIDGLAKTLELTTDLIRPLLPTAEAIRLDSLVATLDGSARGLRYGNLSVADAKATTKTALTVAFSELGALGTSAITTSIGTLVSKVAPGNARVAAIGVSFAFGLALDGFMDATGLYERVAGLLTDGLFGGVATFEAVLDRMQRAITEGRDILIDRQFDPYDNPYGASMTTSGSDFEQVALASGIEFRGTWREQFNDAISTQLPFYLDAAGNPSPDPVIIP